MVGMSEISKNVVAKVRNLSEEVVVVTPGKVESDGAGLVIR